ncbi:MAG: aldolase [Patescibacteria group bacterium]|jgi:fructose-bisphosphate aldolase/6-deoxy-5-ketofructose 1-phosphate synthase
MTKQKIQIPLSVPGSQKNEYQKNYHILTGGTGRLLLIAGDQKVEHLNDDFSGVDISPEDNDPEHLFKIAAASAHGVLATHLGLIARYGQDYRSVPYVVKLNGKTNLNKGEASNSSRLWWSVADIIKFKKDSGLKIVGLGYTLYLGGRYEAKMLAAAAQVVYQAHQAGLTAILWVYPRGPKINEENIHTIAGGAGVAAALDADFAKVKYPVTLKNRLATAKKFQEATQAAGRTKIICVGGSYRTVKNLLEDLSAQIKISGTNGLAMGRNLHQRSLEDASRLAAALSAIIFHNKNAAEAYNIYLKKTSSQAKSKFLGLF